MTGMRRHWTLVTGLLCALLVWQPVFVTPAARFNDEVMVSAVKVYAILRGINAAISVAKETEIGVQFVGSVTTQPGMVLDPIDETVGRVADAVFMLAAASGVLSIAFAPLAQIGAGLAALGFLALWLAGLRPEVARRVGSVGKTLAGFGLVLALALPLGYGIGGRLGAAWTESARVEAQDRLNGTAEDLSEAVDAAQANVTQQAENAGPDTPGADASLWSRVWDGVSDAGGAASDAVREAVPDMDAVQVRGGEILQSSLTLIAIYVFRLLVLPFVLLWGGLLLARRVLAA